FDGGRVSKTNGSRQEVEFVLAPNKAQVDEINNDLCMVENFLGERVINFSTRESTLLSLWRPIQAAHIKPIGDNGSYIIHFFHPVHGLLPGFASEALVKSLGNVIRSFIDYDFSGHNSNNQGMWDYEAKNQDSNDNYPMSKLRIVNNVIAYPKLLKFKLVIGCSKSHVSHEGIGCEGLLEGEQENLDGSQVGEESSGVNKENEAMKIGEVKKKPRNALIT
ncbi:hypothetical protein Godav_004103, partial [Gossypium davidsonii]|nr:hypothetical protein [Gossypium davidsonii]MBA0662056.1 hypothetical protein [Gossypium klotzschianum]